MIDEINENIFFAPKFFLKNFFSIFFIFIFFDFMLKHIYIMALFDCLKVVSFVSPACAVFHRPRGWFGNGCRRFLFLSANNNCPRGDTDDTVCMYYCVCLLAILVLVPVVQILSVVYHLLHLQSIWSFSFVFLLKFFLLQEQC